MANTATRRRLRKVLLWLGGALLVPVLLGLLGGGVLFAIYWPTLPEVPDKEEFLQNLPGITRVYGARGELLAELYEEYREPIPYERIPRKVIEALIAAEDQRFFAHRGADLSGLARAALTNLKAGRIVQGGSTLTQQLAKLLLGTDERTLERKIRELLFALSIEKKLSKEDILTMYLNLVFFGEGAYGIQGAAKTFFSKDVSELSTAEAALLVGLVRAPSATSPLKAPEKALSRRNFVLKRMQAEGFLSKEELLAAEKEPLTLRPRSDPFREVAPYPTESVRRELLALYGEDLVLRGALTVETTLDLDAQRFAEESMYDGLRELDKRMGWRGPEAHLTDKKERSRFIEKAKARYQEPLTPGQLYLALVTRVSQAGADVTVGAVEGTLPLEEMRWAAPFSVKNYENNHTISDATRALKEGDVVLVRLAKRQSNKPDAPPRFALEQEPYIQGSIFTYDIESGYTLAYVAGRNYDESEFDRIAQGCRQPGSTFKPIYYALALQKGYTPETILSDRPREEVDPETGETWIPYNVDGTYLVECTLRTALVQSRNLPSIEVFELAGAPNVVRWSEHLGITTPLIADRALALGASCVRPYDLAKAFGVFANEGRQVTPTLLKRVRDREGRLLLDRSHFADPFLSPEAQLDRMIASAVRPPKQLIPRQTAYDITSLLRQVVTNGLAWHAGHVGAPAAGKTGTSSRTADLWFVGFTSQFLTTVWIGSDAYERPLGAKEQSSHVAVPLWTEYMKKFLAGRPQQEIPRPIPKPKTATPTKPPASLPAPAGGITPTSVAP